MSVIPPLERTRRIDRRHEELTRVWTEQPESRGARVPQIGRVLQAGPGGELLKLVVSTIDSAKEVVLLSSFLLGEPSVVDVLLKVARRKVRVYLLTAPEERLEEEESDRAEREEILAANRRTLQRLAGWTLARTAPSFHAKFVVVDPVAPDSRGLLLTANLSPQTLTRNAELAVQLSRPEIQELAALFAHAFWARAQHQLLDGERLAAVNPRTTLPTPSFRVIAPTVGTLTALREAVVALIDSASESLVVSAYKFDHSIVEQAVERAILERRARVTLLVPRSEKGLSETVHRFAERGATVFGVERLHAKALVADGARGLVLTSNLSRLGLDEGFEVGVQLRDGDARDLAAMLGEWCTRARWRYRASVPLGEVQGKILRVEEGGTREEIIREQVDVELSQVLLPCASMRGQSGCPEQGRRGRAFAHSVNLCWKEHVPELSARARLVPLADGVGAPFPLYEDAGRRVFAVSNEADIALAAAEKTRWNVDAIVAMRSS